ncbi:MAG: hypothetical protein SO130_10240, partial [Agathobacter sp.]|nr:hypothetical protein [Agathobacter sp.]
MVYDFVVLNFVPLAGILFLFIFLICNGESEKRRQYLFYLILALELLEMIFYSAEFKTEAFAHPTLWRTLFSALCYSIRPMLLIGLLCLSLRKELSKQKFILLSIPAVINILASFSAFFTGIVYSYNAKNELVRGPLGYTMHVIVFFYLIMMLICSIRSWGKGVGLENLIILSSFVVVVIAIVLEAVFSVRSLGRSAIVLSTIAYYLYFQTQTYNEQLRAYMENTISTQQEHLREMNVISVLANEYVTVCYVDVEKNIVTPYRMDPFIEERYGDALRSGVPFEHIFQTYITKDILEEDRDFFLNLANLQEMLSYLRQHGRIARKYRVMREGVVLYCEMRAELVSTDSDVEDIVIGFSNNDTRVRKEMIYQSTVQQEIDKVIETKESLSGIASLAKQLQ